VNCKTFVYIGENSFPGLLVIEQREHPVYGNGCFGYLSAHLENQRFVHVERWGFDSEITENELRAALKAMVAKPEMRQLRLG
jgi:hypothetical protein